MDKVKVETYKDIDLFYDKDEGRICFTFEGSEREVKYVFEARRIIDEPVWEECDLKGFFVDGVFNDYIGKAIAKRKDIKSGRPDWRYKGKYGTDYKKGDNKKDKVYPYTQHNVKVYADFENQRKIVSQEEQTLKQIISCLSEASLDI